MAFNGFKQNNGPKGGPNAKEIQDSAEESQSGKNPEEHNIGCPRYRLLTKAKRSTAKSPQRNPTNLHPKPWGARDPKEIACSCSSSRRATVKSAPSSRRVSPIRDFEKFISSSRIRVPTRRHSSRSRTSEKSTREELLKMFDELCEKGKKIGGLLTPDDLQMMISKLTKTFGSNTIDVVKRGKELLNAGNSVTEASKETEKVNASGSEDSLNTQPSVIEAGVNAEAVNPIWGLSGSTVPDQTIAYSNFISSMIPHDNYVVTFGNNLIPLDRVLQPQIHQETLVFENTHAFIPSPPVQPRRMPRGSRSPMRRPPH